MEKSTKNLVFVAGALALVGWIVFNHYFDNRREEMDRNHKQHLAAVNQKHTQHVAAVNQKHTQEAQAKQREYRTELETAWGGSIETAIKDPDLKIADMLRKAAIAACPQALDAEVKTDNFTEFDVYINVKAPIDKKTAAATMKALLRHCGKYVNSASFVYQDEVVKTIDRGGIDAIKDWSSVPLATVSGKMYTP